MPPNYDKEIGETFRRVKNRVKQLQDKWNSRYEEDRGDDDEEEV